MGAGAVCRSIADLAEPFQPVESAQACRTSALFLDVRTGDHRRVLAVSCSANRYMIRSGSRGLTARDNYRLFLIRSRRPRIIPGRIPGARWHRRLFFSFSAMPVHIDPNRYLDPVQYDLDPVDETNRAWAQAYAELEEALRKVGPGGELYVVCGLSCAGKTTWVQHHFSRLGEKVVFFDAAVPARAHRQKVLQLAHKHSVPATAVWIEISSELALQRNRELPAETRLPESTVRHAFALYQLPSTDEGFVRVMTVQADDPLN